MQHPRPASDQLRAVHALGQLDSAAARSSVAPLWRERAAVAGLADCLTLSGQPLSAAEFFRIIAGVQPVAHDAAIDRAAIVATATALLPYLGAAPTVARLLGAVRRRHAFDDDRPPALTNVARAEIVAALNGSGGADVGTALRDLGTRIEAACVVSAMPIWSPDVHAFVAAALPAALARWGVTRTPLPCLTGLARSPALYSGNPAALGDAVLLRLGVQAGTGLALLQRLEACAAAWRDRLHGRSVRSRSGRAAALFLVWPALTRGQVADALGLSQPGAGVILETLVACDIVEVQRIGAARYFVAPESLADFKLQPRQGRHRALPAPTQLAGLGDLTDAVDAALAVFDRLDKRPQRWCGDDATSEPAYPDQPSGLSPG